MMDRYGFHGRKRQFMTVLLGAAFMLWMMFGNTGYAEDVDPEKSDASGLSAEGADQGVLGPAETAEQAAEASEPPPAPPTSVEAQDKPDDAGGVMVRGRLGMRKEEQ